MSEITRRRAQRPANMAIRKKCCWIRNKLKDHGRYSRDIELYTGRNLLSAGIRKKAYEH